MAFQRKENDKMQTPTLPILPPEVWEHILAYLDFETLQKKAVLVSKDWKKLIRESPNLSGHLVLHLPEDEGKYLSLIVRSVPANFPRIFKHYSTPFSYFSKIIQLFQK